MAQFFWHATPPFGTCLACGTSANDRGFVDTLAEVNVRAGMEQESELIGIASAIFCASCLEQMGRLVGLATPNETEGFAHRELELVNENEKLKDEIQSWQQRFLGLANLDVDDFEKLAKLERASKMVIVEEAPSDDPPA